jgi:hypothetical protein
VTDELRDLDRRSGKGPEDAHPEMAGGRDDPDPSDYSDPAVAQHGDDPPGEDALGAPIADADRLRGGSGAGRG